MDTIVTGGKRLRLERTPRAAGSATRLAADGVVDPDEIDEPFDADVGITDREAEQAA